MCEVSAAVHVAKLLARRSTPPMQPVSWSSIGGGESLANKYSVEDASLLGRGKFSTVHRTQRRADGMAVAIKTIQARCADGTCRKPLRSTRAPDARRMHTSRWRAQVFEMASNDRNECMNEIRLLQSMQHPHVIQYLDCVMEDNELRVVMEMAEFGDLARRTSAPRVCIAARRP